MKYTVTIQERGEEGAWWERVEADSPEDAVNEALGESFAKGYPTATFVARVYEGHLEGSTVNHAPVLEQEIPI